MRAGADAGRCLRELPSGERKTKRVGIGSDPLSAYPHRTGFPDAEGFLFVLFIS
jgi:hypothetical protein